MKEKIKIAVTGAAGQIGYALLFRLISGEVFGKDAALQLNLLELPKAMPALEGVLMELEDCASNVLDSVSITDDANQAFKDIDWAILVGSVPRRQGMERADLLKVNAQVFVEQGAALNLNAKKTVKVLVVGNPCNTNAYIVKQKAKDLSAQNIFALTMLDQNRATALLAKKAGVSTASIDNMIVWGNHSLTQFPDFFHAAINDKKSPEVISERVWLEEDFLEAVQKRGAAVIKARGSSSAASAAKAITDTIYNIASPKNKAPFSLGVVSDGSYGIDPGLVFSFPVWFEGGSWQIAQGVDHNNFASEKILATKYELLQEKKIVDTLLI